MPETFDRRVVLGGASAVLAGAGLISLPVTKAYAQSAAEVFLDVSRIFTGHPKLDAVLADAFRTALAKGDPEIDAKTAQLAAAYAQSGAQSIDRFDLATLSPPLKAYALALIAAWYSGIVGSGKDAHVVSYDHALMFDAVRDAVVVQTYCSWRPDYWVQAAPAAPAQSNFPPI